MWPSRLFWKLLAIYAVLNLALAGIYALVALSWQGAEVAAPSREGLADVAAIVRNELRGQSLTDLPTVLSQRLRLLAADTEIKLAVIDPQGRVLADSQQPAEQFENQASQPEIREAEAAGLGWSSRVSPIDGEEQYYLALPIETDGKVTAFVRAAVPARRGDEHAAWIRTLLWGLALVMVPLAAALTHLAVRRIARPVSQLRQAVDALAGGDYAQRIAVSGSEELDALGAQFKQMQHTLSSRVNELQSNSERLQTVLGSMVEGVIAVDTNEQILLANEASKSLLSFVTPEVIGRPLREVTRSLAVHEAVMQAFQNAAPCRSEFEVAGATRRVLALRAGRLPGTPCPGVLVVLHDVTDLRRLENLRREFVANVSHELKTPLASIKAYAETLRMGAMDDPEHNLTFIHRIEEQAERLHQLILDMLALARVESGQEAFEMADVELAALVQSCVEQHAEVAAAKQISVQTVPAERPVLARADEEGLRTILNNLVDNAIKYTPAGGQVTLRWWAEEALAVFEVQDTGIGIARGDQERIFERFYRVDRARSRELGGTGLGLSIVKHLAQAFGGQVALTSRPGEGSTFQIRLPLA